MLFSLLHLLNYYFTMFCNLVHKAGVHIFLFKMSQRWSVWSQECKDKEPQAVQSKSAWASDVKCWCSELRWYSTAYSTQPQGLSAQVPDPNQVAPLIRHFKAIFSGVKEYAYWSCCHRISDESHEVYNLLKVFSEVCLSLRIPQETLSDN